MPKKRKSKVARRSPKSLSSAAMELKGVKSRKERISPKDASKAAWQFYEQVTGHVAVSLEEIELSDDGERWWVTLGVRMKGPFAISFAGTGTGSQLKRFEVDAYSGDVLTMRIGKG